MADVSPKLLKLADLLDGTADNWNDTITLLAEHLATVDQPVAESYRRIAAQLHVAATRIREGEYSDG